MRARLPRPFVRGRNWRWLIEVGPGSSGAVVAKIELRKSGFDFANLLASIQKHKRSGCI
jgi:hypothetical protein